MRALGALAQARCRAQRALRAALLGDIAERVKQLELKVAPLEGRVAQLGAEILPTGASRYERTAEKVGPGVARGG